MLKETTKDVNGLVWFGLVIPKVRSGFQNRDSRYGLDVQTGTAGLVTGEKSNRSK